MFERSSSVNLALINLIVSFNEGIKIYSRALTLRLVL